MTGATADAAPTSSTARGRKRILIGVGGGIAAYKVCSLIRHFTEAGHDVRVVPTRAALEFVGAATFEALSGNPVSTEVFERVFGRSWPELGMELVYDVAHNIAKFEEHTIDGQRKTVCVHRKGATRAFPPGHEEVAEPYRAIGQPVIIPGDMGRASWLLAGAPGSMAKTFGTTCHGAGRAMSRTASAKDARGRRIDDELRANGIIAAPTSVSRTAPGVRSNSSWPSSRSSRRTCALTPDCATWTRSAALVKFASSATATKYPSCLSSITDDASAQHH